jgi:hypothetical protein
MTQYINELDAEGTTYGIKNGTIGMLIIVGFTIFFWSGVCGLMVLVMAVIQ